MSTPRNLADLLRAAGSRAGDRTALVAEGASLTWAQLDALVDRRARGLRAQGVDVGDRVGLALGNTVDFVVSYFAVLRAGMVALPLNADGAPGELIHQITDARARGLLCRRQTFERLPREELGALAVVAVAGAGEPPAAAMPIEGLDVDGDPVESGAGAEDLAVLLYTAGTTGRPRGAMLSHRALLANLDQLSTVDIGHPPGAHDVGLLVLPLFHVYGLNAGLGMLVRRCGTGVLVDRFDPVETLRLITEHGITRVVGAPPMYVAWAMLPEAAQAFSGVRVAISGAAPLPPSVLSAFQQATGHAVYEGYGMTEAAPVITTNMLSGDAPKPGSIGRPLPGIELRLRDESGAAPADGDPGEIVVRGANLFSGYWPDGSGGPDADGWFRTGDVAYADADGDLYIVDRLRELIIVSGFNVYPREVEAVLETHPDVVEAAVVGVTHPYTGESVKAFVVRRAGSDLRVDELIAFAAESLARFKCPTAVEFVDELPRAAAGKVARGRLRAV